MKRIMALLMGIIMLVSAFAGCSNTSPTPADTMHRLPVTTPPPIPTAV